ncbi:MAG: hypothetical protein ACLQAT_23630, partial [Candidatus Binataceae bacterium]
MPSTITRTRDARGQSIDIRRAPPLTFTRFVPVCGELLILLENQQLSGGTMARTGLRMMPTFPSSSLRFRTAGFP